MKVVSYSEIEAPEHVQTLLTCTYGKADSKIFLHVIVASTSSCDRRVIDASDTEVLSY